MPMHFTQVYNQKGIYGCIFLKLRVPLTAVSKKKNFLIVLSELVLRQKPHYLQENKKWEFNLS